MVQAGSSSGMGSGGMASKLEAARIANAGGADLIIVSGHEAHPLRRIDGGAHGTLFAASVKTKGRKTWLAGRLTVRGTIKVDAGAAKALASGASLLAAGATGATGTFARGDVIDITGPDGTVIARGLSEYDATEVARIVGLKSDAIARTLGYAPRSALVHRDHMVHL